VDVVDQRAQSVGPHVLGHLPVTQPGGVVLAGAEPPVVEHVAFDPDLGSQIRQPA
jgi:hypothetical protein